jgi:hypothetical protein
MQICWLVSPTHQPMATRSMSEASTARWSVLGSSVREVALIVTGILIAFFLDAWWDNRVEQREIRAALHAAQLDFLATQAELDAVITTNRAYAGKVAELIALGSKRLSDLDPAAADAYIGLLPTGGITFDPVLGSVDALISSGQLHRLDNIALRSAIASWPSLLDEIGEDHEILIDMYMAQQERSVELGLYTLARPNTNGNTAADWRTEYLRRVLDDEEMLNRLEAHRFATEELNKELEAVGAHLQRLLKLLRAELGETAPD